VDDARFLVSAEVTITLVTGVEKFGRGKSPQFCEVFLEDGL
jgi:hypothetical protein